MLLVGTEGGRRPKALLQEEVLGFEAVWGGGGGGVEREMILAVAEPERFRHNT